jgi:hypothetical protein
MIIANCQLPIADFKLVTVFSFESKRYRAVPQRKPRRPTIDKSAIGNWQSAML